MTTRAAIERVSPAEAPDERLVPAAAVGIAGVGIVGFAILT